MPSYPCPLPCDFAIPPIKKYISCLLILSLVMLNDMLADMTHAEA